MNRPRVLVVLFSLAIGLVAGLVPSTAVAGSAAARQLAGPGYHEPEVGQCYDLSAKQAAKASSTQTPVACDAPHTLMTVKVKRLPKGVKWKSLTTDAFYVACEEAMIAALGGSAKLAAMSAYDWWFFIPTDKERAKGARWVRCDIGLHQGRTGLNPLPATLGLTAFPLSNQDSRCLIGKNLVPTSCQQGHDWRVKGAYRLDTRPKTSEQFRKAAKRCQNVTNSRRWAYDGPTAQEWKAGNHFMVCIKPD